MEYHTSWSALLPWWPSLRLVHNRKLLTASHTSHHVRFGHEHRIEIWLHLYIIGAVPFSINNWCVGLVDKTKHDQLLEKVIKVLTELCQMYHTYIYTFFFIFFYKLCQTFSDESFPHIKNNLLQIWSKPQGILSCDETQKGKQVVCHLKNDHNDLLQICCLHGSYSSITGLPGRYTVRECTIYRLTGRTWTGKMRRWEDLKVYLHSSPVGSDRWSANRQTLNSDQDGPSSSPPKHESSWSKKKGVMCTSW